MKKYEVPDIVEFQDACRYQVMNNFGIACSHHTALDFFKMDMDAIKIHAPYLMKWCMEDGCPLLKVCNDREVQE